MRRSGVRGDDIKTRIRCLAQLGALALGCAVGFAEAGSAQTGGTEATLTFGDSRLLAACFAADALKGSSNEIQPVKGIRSYDAATSTRDLAAFASVPAGLKGAVRRVKVRDGAKLIALTLDFCEQTGEVAGYDGRIIDYLRAHQIKATLFMGGKWMRSHEYRTRQLMADPLFELGNHGEAHRNLRLLPPRALTAEITGPQKAYEATREGLANDQCVAPLAESLAGVPMRMGLFRFPFGACNAASLQAVGEAGLLAIQWDISTGDPDPRTGAEAIANTVLRRVKPGSIIIAHGNGRGYHTASALPLLIPKLLAQGYKFVTVSELLAAGTPEIEPRCYDARPGDTDRYDRLPFQQGRVQTQRHVAGTGAVKTP